MAVRDTSALRAVLAVTTVDVERHPFGTSSSDVCPTVQHERQEQRVTRVLISGLTDNPGGVETVVLRYVREMRGDLRFDVWTSAERCAFEEEFIAAGCRVFHGRRYSKGFTAARSDLTRFFGERGRDYDALWSNKSMFVNADDLRLGKRAGVARRILHAHNSRAMFPGAAGAARAILHRVNRLRVGALATDYWACSTGAAEYFFTPGVRRSPRFHLVHNALDPRLYSFDPAQRARVRAELGVDDQATIVGFVGRLQYQKNPQFLLEAFGAYHSVDRSSVLQIAGEGDLHTECQRLAEAAGLGEAVRFLGVREDVHDLYQAFDVLLLPSRFEGLPVVVIEAQAAGLPVVAGDSVTGEVALTDLVRFLPTDDPQRWAREISSLLGRQDGRRNTTSEIASGGYDITTESTRLADLLQVGAR